MTDWNKVFTEHNEGVSNIERKKVLHGWDQRVDVFKHVLAHIERGYTMEQIRWNCDANIKQLEEHIEKEKQK